MVTKCNPMMNPMMGKEWNPWKVGMARSLDSSTFLHGWYVNPMIDDDEGIDYDLLKNQYAQELMRIKRGVSAGSLNPDQWSYLPSDYTYTGAEGGRAGYYAGGQSTPSRLYYGRCNDDNNSRQTRGHYRCNETS